MIWSSGLKIQAPEFKVFETASFTSTPKIAHRLASEKVESDRRHTVSFRSAAISRCLN